MESSIFQESKLMYVLFMYKCNGCFYTEKVSSAPIVKIDFRKPKRKATDDNDGSQPNSSFNPLPEVPLPSLEEVNHFFGELAKNEHPVATSFEHISRVHLC